MFQSVEDVQQQFKNARYIANRRISTVVFLAARMGRPVLIEGRPGGQDGAGQDAREVTGRISFGCSATRARRGKALYEWKYAKQLLYTQLLKERIGELIADAPSLPDAVARISVRRRVLLHRFLAAPLLQAIESVDPVCCWWTRSTRRAGVRGVSPRGPVRLPGLGARARHDPAPRSPSSSSLQQRARALRRPQAEVPAPLHRLPARRRGAGDHPLKVPEVSERLARPWSRRCSASAGSSCARPVDLGEPRLGALARHPQRGDLDRTWWNLRSPCS